MFVCVQSWRLFQYFSACTVLRDVKCDKFRY
jgi:hypothetical protein